MFIGARSYSNVPANARACYYSPVTAIDYAKYHNHLRIEALVIRLAAGQNAVTIRAGPGKIPWENHDFTPNAITLGWHFKGLALVQWFTPPKSDTNPWPLQIWDVDLRLIGSSISLQDIGILFPGQTASVVLQGTGFELIPAALAMATEPTMQVGLLR